MRGRITAEIEKLKKTCGTADPFELIACLNINLMIREGLGKLKGFYYTTHHQRYIVINGDLDEPDRLMVAAHELAHDRLHRRLAGVSPLRDFLLYDMSSQTEHQANVFAAELLISDEEVLAQAAETQDYLSFCACLGFHPQLVSFKLYAMLGRGHALNLPDTPRGTFLR